MNNVEYGLIMQEMERGDSGVRSFVSVQSALCMYPIHTFGSEEQKEQWLPDMAAGTKLGCFGLTEPDAGSNPGAMRTRARREGHEYVLSGEKMWITSGTIADVAVIWAKNEEQDRPARLQRKGRAREMVSAGLGHLFPVAARRPHPLSEHPAEIRRAQVGAHVPEPGAVRDCLGSARRSHGVLRHSASVCAIP